MKHSNLYKMMAISLVCALALCIGCKKQPGSKTQKSHLPITAGNVTENGTESAYVIKIETEPATETGNGFGTATAADTDKSEEDFALFDAFLNNEIYVYYPDNFEYAGEPFKYEDRVHDEDESESMMESGRIDVNNDGKKDLIMEDYYGETYIYAKEGKLYVPAEPNGTAVRTSHTYYDGAEWIVTGDTCHAGRVSYYLEKFNGDGEVVDEFDLSAEYWDDPDYCYDENSDFTYRGKPITMQEFEKLRYEIFGH